MISGGHRGLHFGALLMWACDQCTFQNEERARRCAMCESARTTKKPRVADPSTPNLSADSLFAELEMEESQRQQA